MTAPSRTDRICAAVLAFGMWAGVARTGYDAGWSWWMVVICAVASLPWLWQAYREWKCGGGQ